MSDGSLPAAPICTDVTKLDGRDFKGIVDLIIAGFPCQDISCAGNGAGLEGERSGLFFEVIRLAKEIQSTFLFLENVQAIRTRGLDTVIQELTEAGYDCRWTMLSAAEIGAPHKRERWFLLAKHAQVVGLQTHRLPERTEKGQSKSGNPCEYSPWSDGNEVKPALVGVVNGVSLRVERIKRLGNAVVPLQAKTAFEILMGLSCLET
jgi:DNA (cytosine-5)-methyltransferase 1